MQLDKLVEILAQIAPLGGAEEWDNVGLLAGDPRQKISNILLTIDLTAEVFAEAKRGKCDLVIAYHPPIFKPIKRLSAGHVVFEAIRSGIAIYSPHTALDAAEGGTNDVLADAIGLKDRRFLRAAPGKLAPYKLVVFVPGEAVDKVSRALFDAGAGHIGDYHSCSFRIPGTGTFFGEPGTNPAVGSSGKLERVEEIRLETLVPIDKAANVIAALRSAHPYEEPAFDLHVLAGESAGGMGRIGTLNGVPRKKLFEKIKRALGIKRLLIAGPMEGAVHCAAVCAGACGAMLEDAIAAGAEFYLTGELRHHDALRAAAAGMTVVCTLHSNSERAVLKRLKQRLAESSGVPEIWISKTDRDPFKIA